MGMEYKAFGEIDLADPFFDSLKADYVEFSEWYRRKADAGERALNSPFKISSQIVMGLPPRAAAERSLP